MKELRTAEIKADAPTAEGGGNLVLIGTPIVYDTPTTINDPAGSYTEVIKRGALDGADIADSRLLYNHDLNRIPLARTPKTLHFNVTGRGLEMRAELPDTEEARSIYTAVKRRPIRHEFCVQGATGRRQLRPEDQHAHYLKD